MFVTWGLRRCPTRSTWTDLNWVFSLGKVPGLTCSCLLMDSLADRARFDELFDVLPHAWPNIPIPGHLDGLLLASIGVFMQCFYRCWSTIWSQKEDGVVGHFWRFSSRQKSQQPSPFFSGQEKSEFDANLSLPSPQRHPPQGWPGSRGACCYRPVLLSRPGRTSQLGETKMSVIIKTPYLIILMVFLTIEYDAKVSGSRHRSLEVISNKHKLAS